MSRHWVTLGLLAMAVAAPAAADKEFVAMGDSITAGSGWPVVSSVVFDCEWPGCRGTGGGRENCGHAARLDAWMDGWLGDGDHVRNHGWGAERTEEGVVRLPGVLDDECGLPGACNAVMLMHGTNDMNGSVSPETARTNLALMIGEARSRNIDTLLISIIRRAYAASNSKWKSYRDLVLALAAAENLQFVDAWLTLCATTSCFNTRYWVDHPSSQCTDPGQGDNDLGHLDPDGYDDLTDLIKAAFPAVAPAAATPSAPLGDISDAQPLFNWPEDPQARWWELEVDGAATWWEAAEHCAAGGSCTVDPGMVLALGAHSWRVRGRNLRGMGAWSAGAGFTIWEQPGTPVTTGPAGLFIDPTPMTAPLAWEPYSWSEDAAATDYDLVVADLGGPVVVQSFDSSICGGSVCSVSPAAGLSAGDYNWTVQARNPAASGAVSAPLAFQVHDSVPGEATPRGPTGDRFELFAPLYSWLPALGAEEYDLEVKDLAGNVDDSVTGLSATAVCSDGLCSHQGGTLPDPDAYSLRVLARNSLGDGSLSSTSADFTILACSDPAEEDLADLAPPPVSTTVAVAHCGPVVAGESGAYTITSTGDLTVHTREGFAILDEFTIEGLLTVRDP